VTMTRETKIESRRPQNLNVGVLPSIYKLLK